MLTTLVPMVTLVRLAHEKNAREPIFVTPSGMEMLVRFWQKKNRLLAMLVRLSGSVMLPKLLH